MNDEVVLRDILGGVYYFVFSEKAPLRALLVFEVHFEFLYAMYSITSGTPMAPAMAQGTQMAMTCQLVNVGTTFGSSTDTMTVQIIETITVKMPPTRLMRVIARRSCLADCET